MNAVFLSEFREGASSERADRCPKRTKGDYEFDPQILLILVFNIEDNQEVFLHCVESTE